MTGGSGDVRPALRLAPAPPPADLVEARAVARLRSGDMEALGDLYDLHHAAVRAFAVRFLGDAVAAEDLLHDVFVGLPRAIAGYRGDAPLRSFLVAMAANQSKNHVRAAVRRRSLVQRASREPEPTVAAADDAHEREELGRMLQRALDQLSHEHRVTFVLCEIEERTSPAVAIMLGIPEATVRTRLFHAKKRLRELLGDER